MQKRTFRSAVSKEVEKLFPIRVSTTYKINKELARAILKSKTNGAKKMIALLPTNEEISNSVRDAVAAAKAQLYKEGKIPQKDIDGYLDEMAQFGFDVYFEPTFGVNVEKVYCSIVRENGKDKCELPPLSPEASFSDGHIYSLGIIAATLGLDMQYLKEELGRYLGEEQMKKISPRLDCLSLTGSKSGVDSFLAEWSTAKHGGVFLFLATVDIDRFLVSLHKMESDGIELAEGTPYGFVNFSTSASSVFGYELEAPAALWLKDADLELCSMEVEGLDQTTLLCLSSQLFASGSISAAAGPEDWLAMQMFSALEKRSLSDDAAVYASVAEVARSMIEKVRMIGVVPIVENDDMLEASVRYIVRKNIKEDWKKKDSLASTITDMIMKIAEDAIEKARKEAA